MYILPNLFKYIKFSNNYIVAIGDNKERINVSFDYINYNNLKNDLYNVNNIMILTNSSNVYNDISLKIVSYNSNDYQNKIIFNDIDVLIIDICSNYNIYLILNIFRYIIHVNNKSQLIFKMEKGDEIFYDILYILSNVYDKILIKKMNNNYDIVMCDIYNIDNIDTFNNLIIMLENNIKKGHLNITKLYGNSVPQIFKNKLLEIIKHTNLQT